MDTNTKVAIQELDDRIAIAKEALDEVAAASVFVREAMEEPPPPPPAVVGWRRVGKNTFADVAFTRASHAVMVAAGSQEFWGAGPIAAISHWGGAAFDTLDGIMLFHGGGHFGYGGNEVTVFNWVTELWERITNPSPLSGPDMTPEDVYTNPGPLVGPHAGHTYDALVWHPLVRRMYSLDTGTGYVQRLNGPQVTRLAAWSFDRENREWHDHGAPAGMYLAMSCWNGDLKEVWCLGHAPHAKCIIVNAAGEISEETGGGQFGKWPAGAMDYDPTRGFAFALSNKILCKFARTATGLTGKKVSDIPVEVIEAVGFAGSIQGAGLAMRNGTVWLWGGGSKLVTFNPDSGQWRIVSPVSGPRAPGQIYGKFHYWPQRDAFVGVTSEAEPWVFTPGDDLGELIDPDAVRVWLAEQGYQTLQSAFDAASDGVTATIVPGDYAMGAFLERNGMTINAEDVHIRNGAVGAKGTFVVKGNDTVIVGLEASEVAVPDNNGAVVRMEGKNLTLRRVHFHDSQQGLLGGGGIINIDESLFERLGHGGQAHGIYVSQASEALIISGSRFLASKDEGHEVKSRAERTEIYGTVIDNLDSRDSRNIDVPQGGVLVIDGATIRKGPNSSNREMIGYALEKSKVFHRVEKIVIRNTTFINDYGPNAVFLRIGVGPDPTGHVPAPVIEIDHDSNTYEGIEPVIEYR